MNIEATAWLAFCVKVDRKFKSLLEDEGALREYDERTGADLGFLEVGYYQDEELFITTYYVRAETLGSKEVDLTEISDEKVAVWCGQIQRFLREHNIPQMSPMALRLIADLDD